MALNGLSKIKPKFKPKGYIVSYIKTNKLLPLRRDFLKAIDTLDKAKLMLQSKPLIEDLHKAKEHLKCLVEEIDFTLRKRTEALDLPSKLESRMVCPATNESCIHYTYQRDRNGDVAIIHCDHHDNVDTCEGNCTIELCPKNIATTVEDPPIECPYCGREKASETASRRCCDTKYKAWLNQGMVGDYFDFVYETRV